MKLTVKNFGPIHEAKDINVSPMTIFVGPSNTGKSYLAILIYSIVKALGDENLWERVYLAIRKNEDKGLDIPSSQKNQDVVTAEEIEKSFLLWASVVSKAWKEQFVYCLGEVGKNILEDEKEKISIVISDSKNQFILDLSSPDNSKLTSQKKLQIHKSTNNALLKDITDHFGERHLIESDRLQSSSILQFNYPQILTNQFRNSLSGEEERTSKHAVPHYLPATRGGIMQSHRTLVGAVIEQAPMAGLNKISPTPLFSGVLADFMQKLLKIDDSKNLDNLNPREQKKKFNKIGFEIEEKIMRGNINVQMSDAHYPDFRYKFHKGEKEHDLPLMSASSMVSELTPVSLFIRHYVSLGDLFIVEEPEAHLHPAAQRKISNILVQLVNAGVYVLVTTHSDNILEQISNYIHASDVGTKLAGQALKKERISAYLFDPTTRSKHKNTVVKTIPFDKELGILTKDHLDVSSDLYNETVDLYNRREKNTDKDTANDI